MVLDKLAHSVHHDFRLQAFIEVVDVSAELILRSLWVVFHPALDCFTRMVRASAANTAAAVEIHSSHKGRLQDLDKRMVDVLVGPLCWLADRSPFLCAGVPSARNVRFFRFKAVDDDFPQLFHPLVFGFFNPSSAFVRTVMRPPMMSAVYLVDCFYQVLI